LASQKLFSYHKIGNQAHLSGDQKNNFQLIRSVTKIEFDVVPQYMRGRLMVERVNSAVETINRIIEEKYTLLRMNPAKVSVEMRQRFFVS